MSASAADGTRTRPAAGDLVRFVLGLLASAALVAGTGLALLAALPQITPGWRTTVVASGSMAPALAVGDAVAVEAWPTERGMLGPPSVVLVDRPGLLPLLHRVVDDDGRTYRTKGDANESVDGERVAPAQVLGVGRLVVPGAGWIALRVAERDAGAVAAAAAGLAALVALARYGWLDRYDPWLAARRRAAQAAVKPTTPEPSAPAGPAPSEPGGRVSSPEPVSAERPEPVSPAGRGVLLAPAVAVLAALLVVALVGGAGTSASALSARTSSARTLGATTVLPAGALTARCTTTPAVVDAVTAGPTTAAPALPDDVRVGDHLILSRGGIRPWNATTSAHEDPPVPAGWTQLGIATGGAERFHAVYRRAAVAGDAGTLMPHEPDYADVLLVARGGVVSDSSLAGRVVEGPTAPGPAIAPSVDGKVGGLLLTFWGIERNDTTYSTPTGMTEVAKTAFRHAISMAAHEQKVTADGPTGARSTTMTDGATGVPVTGRHSGLSLFIRSTPYATLTWTPSAADRVTGYTILRDGAAVSTVTGRTTTTWRDPAPLGAGEATYTVVARAGSWSSPAERVTTSGAAC